MKRNKNADVEQRLLDEIEAEKIKQQTFKPSVFITQTMNLVSGKNISHQLYVNLLNKSKNTVINPIKKEKKKIDPLKTKELDEIETFINNYNIRLDDIVN